MWYPSTWVSIINHIGCGLAVAAPTGSCFTIERSSKDQLGLNLPCSFQGTGQALLSICGCGYIRAIPTGSILFYQKLFYESAYELHVGVSMGVVRV